MNRKTLVASSLALTSLVAVAVAATGQEHVVNQKDKQFSQAEITVKAGDTVVFKNSDGVAHNIFSATEGSEFNTKNQAPGTEVAVPFKTEGTVEVRCALHPKMKLVVKVTK